MDSLEKLVAVWVAGTVLFAQGAAETAWVASDDAVLMTECKLLRLAAWVACAGCLIEVQRCYSFQPLIAAV